MSSEILFAIWIMLLIIRLLIIRFVPSEIVDIFQTPVIIQYKSSIYLTQKTHLRVRNCSCINLGLVKEVEPLQMVWNLYLLETLEFWTN